MWHEAAGLLELRGARALYTFPFFFLFSRGAGSGRSFGALTTTPLVTPGFGLSRLRWGGSSCRCYSWGSL